MIIRPFSFLYLKKVYCKFRNEIVLSAVVLFQLDNGKSFTVVCRFDTEVEIEYFKHGGILHYMIRKLL